MLSKHYFLLKIYGIKKENDYEIEIKLYEQEAPETRFLIKEDELISMLKEKYNLDNYDYLRYSLVERNERIIGNGTFEKERFKDKEWQNMFYI